MLINHSGSGGDFCTVYVFLCSCIVWDKPEGWVVGLSGPCIQYYCTISCYIYTLYAPYVTGGNSAATESNVIQLKYSPYSAVPFTDDVELNAPITP